MHQCSTDKYLCWAIKYLSIVYLFLIHFETDKWFLRHKYLLIYSQFRSSLQLFKLNTLLKKKKMYILPKTKTRLFCSNVLGLSSKNPCLASETCIMCRWNDKINTSVVKICSLRHCRVVFYLYGTFLNLTFFVNMYMYIISIIHLFTICIENLIS